MSKSISINENEIKCLREHLEGANRILARLGFDFGSGASERKTPKSTIKESKRDKINAYKNSISAPVRKPSKLKNS